MISQGGFAMITGDPGQGKSKTLQWIAKRLSTIPDITVGVMERPQSHLADFYRELGEIFGVGLTPLNRYGSFTALRAKWKTHCLSTLARPILLIDEAQEVSSACLTELRLLQSVCFDSDSLLFTILCGDERLPDRFHTSELLPLGSRIRARLHMAPFSGTASGIPQFRPRTGRSSPTDDSRTDPNPGRALLKQLARPQPDGC